MQLRELAAGRGPVAPDFVIVGKADGGDSMKRHPLGLLPPSHAPVGTEHRQLHSASSKILYATGTSHPPQYEQNCALFSVGSPTSKM
jgi:hypothetical protein